MMSEHASTIARRMGIGTIGVVGIIEYLVSGSITWASVILGIAVGFVVWAASYIMVYVIEQWLYETGRLTRPHTMRDLVKAYVATDQGALLEVPVSGAGADVMNEHGRNILRLLYWWMTNPDDRGEVLEKISKRSLESHGIVEDRTGEDATWVIEYISTRDLVGPPINNTYQVTDKLKEHLEQLGL